jgi:hypothetical protein
MASIAQYVEEVLFRITKGAPQANAGVWRPAIESTLNTALQRLAEQVAADEGRFPLLMYHYSLHLSVQGEISFAEIFASPTLSNHIPLLSEPAQRRWRLQLGASGDRPNVEQLERVRYRFDLDNPPPCSDFWYYTVGAGNEIDNGIIVRTSDGEIPDGLIVVDWWANGVPLITDPVFDKFQSLTDTGEGDGELFDDLIDQGVRIITEAGGIAALAAGAS